MTDNQQAETATEPEQEPDKDELLLAVSRLQQRYNLVLGIAVVALVVSICVVVWARWG
jgi:hypothetical protein